MPALYLIFGLFVLNHLPIDSRIVWSADRPLTWNDFRGSPDKGSQHAAVTHYEIHSENSYPEPGVVQYEIVCKFNRDASWVKPGSQDNTKLLAHEQLHFDLAECAARDIRRALRAPVPLMDCNERFTEVRDSIQSVWEERQFQYDRETHHGTVEERQSQWSEWVHQQLTELDGFADSRFQVALMDQ